MESWRSHLEFVEEKDSPPNLEFVEEKPPPPNLYEQQELDLLAEDLNKELELINELFGFGGKSREEKWADIAAGEDEEEAPEAGEEGEEKEEKRGFFGKMADYAKGVKDISGFFGKGAGTLLAGEETFDIKKRDQLKDNAKKEIEKWLTNLNYPPLKTIYQKLISDQFPNNDKGDFNSEISLVEKAYDTIADDHQKGQIDTKRANLIIAVMRGMVIYFQDFAIADRYMYIKEQEEGEGEEGEEEEAMGAKEGAVAKNVASAYSKKLPLGLAAGGAAALGAGFAADSQWFQDFLLSLRDMKETIETVDITKHATETLDLGEVKPGEGVIKVIRRLVPGKENFAKGAAGSDLGFLSDPKHKAVYGLLKAAMGAEPGTDVGAFEALVNSDGNAFTTFVSGPMSGRGGTMFAINKGKFQGQFNKIMTKQIERIKKQPAKTIKNWFIKTAGIYLGPVLKALGLGALVAAGVSAAMRGKGKRSSRMAQLKTLVDSMLDVKEADVGAAAGEEEEDTSDLPTEKGTPTPQDLDADGTPDVKQGPGGSSAARAKEEWVRTKEIKTVNGNNMATRESDHFVPQSDGKALKPDALAFAKAQLAWVQAQAAKVAAMSQNPKVDARKRRNAQRAMGTLSAIAKQLAAYIKSTEETTGPGGKPPPPDDAQAAQKSRAAASNAARAGGDAAKKCNPGYTLNSQGACVPFGTTDPGSTSASGAKGMTETTHRWQQLAGILKG
jgi:hypothetical protein